MGEKINDSLIYYLAIFVGFTHGEATGIASGYTAGSVSGCDFSEMKGEYCRTLNDDIGIGLRILLNRLGTELNRFEGDSLGAAQEVYKALAEFKDSSLAFPEELLLQYFELSFMDGLALLAEAAI